MASAVVDIILSLLRSGREYLRDMSKIPLEKIEQTLDITTLIWMLLYGTFPYPSAQEQIEEQLGNIEREIEENPEEARYGFTWLYRIGQVYRLIHVQPIWIEDAMSYVIRPLETKYGTEYMHVLDELEYLVKTPVITTLEDTMKLSDMSSYRTSNTFINRMLEILRLSDLTSYSTSLLLSKIISETIATSDGLSIISKSRVSPPLSETLTTSDEVTYDTYAAGVPPIPITLTYDEEITILDTKNEGSPLPENPEITWWKHGLADSVHLADGLEVSMIVYEVFATKYDGYEPAEAIYSVAVTKYNGYESAEAIYSVAVTKYHGYDLSSVSV